MFLSSLPQPQKSSDASKFPQNQFLSVRKITLIHWYYLLFTTLK